jgi:hypothetical protein
LPQAAAVLLDAIAASDGTRASVTRNLFRTRVEDGILGTFELDGNGDTTAGGVTIYRIERGKPRVLTVITPPKSLRVATGPRLGAVSTGGRRDQSKARFAVSS